jgi:hypothetical protein
VRKLAILSLVIIGALVAGAQGQEKMARRKLPGREKSEVRSRLDLLSGEVSAGEEFRKPLNDDLEFVLRPVGVDLKQGWGIEVVSRKPSYGSAVVEYVLAYFVRRWSRRRHLLVLHEHVFRECLLTDRRSIDIAFGIRDHAFRAAGLRHR